MTDYLVKLTPLTPFFFGGENTFGEGEETNYLAKSNYFPQQTTLLGLIRYELLRQNELLGTDPISKNWEAIIGKQSFQYENTQFTNEYGAIDSLSPVFLMNKDTSYYPQAMDWAMCEKQCKIVNGHEVYDLQAAPIQITFKEPNFVNAYTQQSLESVPYLEVNEEPFNPKYGLKELWLNDKSEKNHQLDYEDHFKQCQNFENGFFVEKKQVGIHRKLSRTKNEIGNFYKQLFYGFENNDFCFAFYLRLNRDVVKNFDSAHVPMGGERSLFAMDVVPLSGNEKSIHDRYNEACRIAYQKSHNSRKTSIILTSDAYCSTDILKHCHFAISDAIPFRNITTQSQKEKDDYASMSREKVLNRNKVLNKTQELLYLLKRGSIFFPKNSSEVEKCLKNSAFQNIGYNQYVSIQ